MPQIRKARWTALLLFCLLPVCVWSQPEFHYLKGLQVHQSGGWMEGPDWVSYERYSYHSDPLEPLRVTSVRWQYDSWMDPDMEIHHDNTYAFPGLVDYDPGEVLIRCPGYAHDGGNTYRLSLISNDGYYLEDRFTENPWAQYHQQHIRYFYNAGRRLIRKTRRVNWPLEYWDHTYTLDARGRRLLENVSSSPDSLNWAPRHSYEYVYGGEAVPDGYQFEKYSAYVPWVYSCGATEPPPFPYLNDSQVISSIIHREYCNGAWCEPDTLALDLSFTAEGAAAAYCCGGFTWTNEGLPKSSDLPGAEPYIRVTFTFSHSSNTAADDPLAPSALSARVSPNPVKDRARVFFSHPKGGTANLRIYNPRGQLLQEKSFADLPPGDACLEWEAVDTRGDKLPNGIYLLRVEAGGNVENARAVLLR